MKLRCIAFAALCVVSGVAAAQSAVQIYGILDIGLANEKIGDTTVTRMDSGNVYGSRIGFRGKEDLGNGLAALFTLETGMNMDTGTGQGPLFNRQSYVGLATGAGTVTLGRQYTTLFRAQLAYDPFFTGFAGNAGRMISNGGGPNGPRIDNSIFYVTPNIAGFEGQLQYGFGEQAGSLSDGREIGAALGYSRGRLGMKAAYNDANDVAGVVSTRNTNLSATYDFNWIKLFTAYQFNKSASVIDTRDALVGLTVPWGQGKFIASYIRKTDRIHDHADANQIAAGYIYALSSRTDLYTSISRIANDSGSRIKVVNGGDTDRLFNIGFDHKF